MGLHQMHVRMTPRLRGGVAGSTPTSITQVIATMVRVTSVVIPEKKSGWIKIVSCVLAYTLHIQNWPKHRKHLTSLFSCVSAGGSCHDAEAKISPVYLSRNRGTRHGCDAHAPGPTLLPRAACKQQPKNKHIKPGQPTRLLSNAIKIYGPFRSFCQSHLVHLQITFLAFLSSVFILFCQFFVSISTWETLIYIFKGLTENILSNVFFQALGLTGHSSHLSSCPLSLWTGHSRSSPGETCLCAGGRTHHHCQPWCSINDKYGKICCKTQKTVSKHW